MPQSSFSEMEFNNSHEVLTRDGETITWNNSICIIGGIVNVTVCLRLSFYCVSIGLSLFAYKALIVSTIFSNAIVV